MVADTIRRRVPFSGLRLLDASRDLKGVADLIADAFREDMDASGERAVRDMRRASRWAFLFGWMDRLAPPGEGFAPGFVWIEDGRVVGNLSLRRTAPGRGWLIGNVAVAPEWRRRGIARQLISAALNLAHERRGEWLALLVRSDNVGAKALYESLGFKDIGESVQHRRAGPMPSRAQSTAEGHALSAVEGHALSTVEGLAQPIRRVGGLRMARVLDADRVYSLAQAAIPEPLRWAEPLRREAFWLGPDRRIANWLTGRHEAWWVIDSKRGFVGAARAEAVRPPDEGRLQVWVAPEWQGEYEDALVRSALASLGDAAQWPMMASTPATHAATIQALESVGFELLRRLTHMRLDLR